ncbi:von Willebrand factor A domain-containing protein 7-like isoform X2 [Ostrea edulis]|uniref:von Willebrand factor A domain-containing protein 7-like isoform X2 n=1 Tax=Ostrea edulis TaxID=37623 RepID=UPI002094DE7F|nr:von Willebrand factor A domain-containing protein 7-like isoform X2 [Ostrea edulis]
MFNQLLSFVLILAVPVLSFPPQTVPGEPHTRSHREITIEGVFRGVARVLQSNALVNTSHTDAKQIVRDYFESDADGFETFYNVILTIIDHENEVQKNSQGLAYVHVNGEQIYRAHMYLCNLRLRIQTIIGTHPLDKDYLLVCIGQYLYTLQEFYSNTNWIEMKGVTINKNLGLVPNLGYEVWALSEDTCDNCEDRPCRNNDYREGKLTSGYKSGQDIHKPAKPSDYQSGKCSHGGLGDRSSKIPARGGINKERFNVTFSPHYYLHPQASEAAVMATDFFISANSSGLVHLIGLKTFLQVFKLRRKNTRKGYSIAFAIDTTGSMSDDIRAVIRNSVNIVTNIQGTENEPERYVLTTFNDPVKVGMRYNTSDGYQMIQQLQLLHAHGGGDCPEYALAGTLAAIELSLPGSTVYVFTDADAKDKSEMSHVIQEAIQRDISIIFMLTGVCGRRTRDKRDTRHTRSTVDQFNKIAQKTGGSVHETTKEQIDEVMETVMEETLPSADVINEVKTIRSGSNLKIFIDTDSSVVKIAIMGKSKNLSSNIQLRNPNDIQITFNKDIRFMYMSTMKLNIVTMKSPLPGEWNLMIVDPENDSVTVNITAQSSLYFATHLMEMDDGLLSALDGNPIEGHRYSLMTTVYSLGNGTVDRMGVLTKSGLHYIEIFPLVNNSTIHTIFLSELKLNTTVSAIVMEGTDGLGFEFRRTRTVFIEPVMIDLSVQQITEEKRYDEPFNITFTITNKGDSPIELTMTINITQGRLTNGDAAIPVSLPPFDNFTSNFPVIGTSSSHTLKYSIGVQKKGDSIDLQRKQNTIMLTHKQHPEFVHINKSSDCPIASLNTANCSLYSWKADVLLQFSDVNVTNITLSSVALLFYVKNDSRINVSIRGDCCTPSTEVQVFDSDFYSVVQSLDFSGGFTVQSIHSTSKDASQVMFAVSAYS